MRNLLLSFILFTVLLSACQNNKKSSETDVLTVTQLLSNVDQLIDQELILTGTVNHVCSHSGRRCFLLDSLGDNTIRVEAGGEIESFSKELMGNTIQVKGFVREDRLTLAEIEEMELEVLEKHPEDAEADGETCSAEMANIHKMREWMKEPGKDYYAIYYVDGLSYDLVE
ncbi:MAG: hypothetical protein JXR22_02055 [Prolixibacteraceae bacterium]|nr:hypothetical protein [Prolixibacteraceae bacterium]